MNKEISVQYAYKKDGKGERHGDAAERMLAAQAKAHGVEPTPATIPMGPVYNAAPPPAPAGFGSAATVPAVNYQNVPPPVQARPPPPPAAPLAAPPSGLPARPPRSQAGYGGPQNFYPPGFNPPQNFPPQGGMPAGFAPPAGFGAPNSAPAPPPPSMPVGFQQYGIRK